jgi:hypothetical protein
MAMLSKPLSTSQVPEQTERGLQGHAYPLIERGLASQARTLMRVGLEAFFILANICRVDDFWRSFILLFSPAKWHALGGFVPYEIIPQYYSRRFVIR